MAIPILLPKVSFVVTEGKVIEWLMKVGDQVSKGDPLLVIETEKASVEIESPGTGILGPELAPVGTVVPVTTTIGYILEEGETSPKLELPTGQGEEAAPEQDQPEEAAEKPKETKWIKVSPLARRIAKENDVDLSKVKGTGPNGRIMQEDILAYVESGGQKQVAAAGSGAKGAPTGSRELQDLSNLQRISAERMTESFQTAPHFYLNVEVDMSEAIVMRKAYLPEVETSVGTRLSFTDILVFAIGRALKANPAVNAKIEDEKVYQYQDVNIALAIDTPRGLAAPVIHHAGSLTLFEIARRRHELVERAQNNRLAPEDFIDATFTFSNLGMFGIDSFHAIVNPPQAAILAAGKIAKRPVVVDDVLELRPTMWLGLSVDHRITDGANGARFLQTLTAYLENPYHALIK